MQSNVLKTLCFSQMEDSTIDRTTYMHFRRGFPRGELVSTGAVTAQPVLAGSPEYTHIIGDYPAKGVNNIVSGTHWFRRASGQVRLSGAVNLLDLSNRKFNCIFVINLD